MSGAADRVAERLLARGGGLAVAESCTGGMLAARLTDRPGASRFLWAGLVVYSDASKTQLLGVRPGTLAGHGAVSEAVVREMVEGARRVTGATAAVAITGVAGPGGGTAEKPVGTVWIAAAVGEVSVAACHRFPGDRGQVREQAVETGLSMLDRLLQRGT